MRSPQPYDYPVLQVKQVSIKFSQQKTVLHDLNLSVARSEIVTIIGSSGVGKSTLLRTLAGLNHLSSGRVLVGDKEMHGPQPNVAIAFQHPGLLPWLNVGQNVAFGLDFKSQPRLSSQYRQERVFASLAEVGLSHAFQLLPEQISGGMAQRVALARCLAREPELLLLDEPFGALDEVTRQSMQTLLLAARKRHQMAVLLVTHDIDEALLVSDRIVLLSGAPASVSHQWTIAGANRDLLSEPFVSLRVEILKTLRQSINAAHGSTAENQTLVTNKIESPELAHVL